MIKKTFDYYYLVLLRHYDNTYKKDRLYYNVPTIIGMTLSVNLFSLSTLFFPQILMQYTRAQFIGLVAVAILIAVFFDIAYNKQYREALREKYKKESIESRRQGVAKVAVYEIVSIIFLIWAVSLTK